MEKEDHKGNRLGNHEKKSAVVTFTEYFSFLAVLNILWVVCSLLVIPILVSTEAVFSCIDKKLKSEKISWKDDYFNYVKHNVWRSNKRGWPFFLILLVLVIDGLILFQMPADLIIRSFLIGALAVLSLLFMFIFFYHYALLTTTTRGLRDRLVHSFVYSIKYPHYSIGIMIVLIAQLGLSLYFVPLIFFFGMSFPSFLFMHAVHKIGQKEEGP